MPTMVEEDRLSETFAALANPTRRAILTLLADLRLDPVARP